jgi:sporulation protein YlmC with PRC-barrel domain
MILSELMGLPVMNADGARAGYLIDVRFVVDGAPHQLLADARLDGIVISPHTRASYWGYDRNNVNSPVILGKLLAWMHRGTFYVQWRAIERVTSDAVWLRDHREEYEPASPSHP